MGRIIEDPSVRINGNSSSGNNESNNNISPLLLGSCPVSNAEDFTLSRKNAECFLYSHNTSGARCGAGAGFPHTDQFCNTCRVSYSSILTPSTWSWGQIPQEKGSAARDHTSLQTAVPVQVVTCASDHWLSIRNSHVSLLGFHSFSGAAHRTQENSTGPLLL